MKMLGRSRQRDLRQMDLLEWMSSAAASPARISATPAKSQELTGLEAAFGLNTNGLSENSNLNMPSSKILTPSEDGALTGLSVDLPASGMMRNGQLLPRAPWVTHMCGSDCTLWPTPRADGGNNAGGSNSRKAAIKRGTYITGNINPSHREWLMGFPIGWTDCDVSGTL